MVVIQTLRKGGGAICKKFFSALLASLWSKNKGGGGPRAPPLDPPWHHLITTGIGKSELPSLESDQHKFSPHNTNTYSIEKMTRINSMII